MSDVEEKLSVENGAEVQPMYDYGVGIDTHKKFIQVCVLVRQGNAIRRYEQEWPTSWACMVAAGEWARKIIKEKSIPTLEPDPLRYSIESTSTYHLPVLKAFQGHPSVVNPVMAGQMSRKTDVLDARSLSLQSMTGLWPASFEVSPAIQEFRLLLKQHDYHLKESIAITNRINNYVLRFGHTLGGYQSIRSMENRSLLEDMCEDDYVYNDALTVEAGKFVCPDGLPDEVKKIIKSMYAEYDQHDKNVDYYQNLAINYAKKLLWETDSGYVKGDLLIHNLLTVPSVGELTILRWLAEIMSPLRFENERKLAAYCGCDPSLKVSAGKVTAMTRRKGNERMHYQLMTVAGACINRHSEPFGRWGYAISQKHAKGGYKKACGAVARRIAVSMYYVHKHNEPFRYDGYNFYKIDVPDIQISDMGLSKRVVNLLTDNGLTNSKTIAEAFTVGDIFRIARFGKKASQEINFWIQNNKNHNSKKTRSQENEE